MAHAVPRTHDVPVAHAQLRAIPAVHVQSAREKSRINTPNSRERGIRNTAVESGILVKVKLAV
jgi:hypothetical protein